MADIRRRIAIAAPTTIRKDVVASQNLRVRLYKASVCNILTYGSEA